VVVDVEGFTNLFRREHPRLVALGLALTGDRESACDLAQETLARAYRSWERFEQHEAPAAWLRRVLINLAVDEHRRAQSEQAAVLRAWPRDMADGLPGADSLPAVGGEWWAAVRALPGRERLAITLFYVEDYSVGEIAAVMEIADGTVRATLAQARKKLAVALAAQEDAVG
jgi:DNA-directed RNA polymerase specialized sigma24 family protein